MPNMLITRRNFAFQISNNIKCYKKLLLSDAPFNINDLTHNFSKTSILTKLQYSHFPESANFFAGLLQ